MASKNIIRIICAVLVICFAAGALVACGAEKVKVTVNDGGKKTEVEIEVDKTVADALDLAKITLGDNDTSDPKADVKITKDLKEITVTRVAATEAPTEAPNTEAPTQAATPAPTAAPKTEAPTEAVTEAPQPDDGGGDDYDYDDGGDSDDGGDDGGVYEVDRQAMPDCDGSGHGYYIITYSDGSTGTEEY